MRFVLKHRVKHTRADSPTTSMGSSSFGVPLAPATLAWQQKRSVAASVSVTVSILVLTGCSKFLLFTLLLTTVKSSQEPPADSVLLHVKVFGATTPSGAVAVQVRLKVL